MIMVEMKLIYTQLADYYLMRCSRSQHNDVEVHTLIKAKTFPTF